MTDEASCDTAANADLPGTELTSSPCLQGERVSFTGTLASMTHRQAKELVERNGGAATDHVSRQTTMLVVGEEGWPLDVDGQPAADFQRAAEWQTAGVALRVLNESAWLRLLELGGDQQPARNDYTPAMLSQLLDLPVSVIRRWERMGLIKPARKVYRLPYFDFREVAGVRKLAELVASGVPRAKIESGLQALSGILGDVDRTVVQLDLLAHGSRVLFRDSHGLLEPVTGQRFIDFEETESDDSEPSEQEATVRPDDIETPDLTAAEWMDEGCRMLDEGEAQEAVEALRMSLMEDGGSPVGNFHLAEALYRVGNSQGAVERYYTAIEGDHNYVEAWTQVGCLHEELGEVTSAIDAFQVALEIHPEYPDAHLHLAELLHRMDRSTEAVPHWQEFLRYDQHGPWADRSRQRLADMDVATKVGDEVEADRESAQ
jgi:tetratricopeptide (TPR) repeat protein